MIAIINRMRYDIETAERLTSFDNGGALFLHGGRGFLTRHAQSFEDGWTSGEKIVPLSEDEALAWLDEPGEPAMIKAYFSHRIRDV